MQIEQLDGGKAEIADAVVRRAADVVSWEG